MPRSANAVATSPGELPADGTLLTARGVRSREALLDAARHVFGAKGYANTTIADITSQADKALGTFYTYFPNKEAVLEHMAIEFKTDMESRIGSIDVLSGNRYDLIHALSSAYWTNCRDHRAELAAIFQASMLDERFAARWREIRADARVQMTATISGVAAAGIASNPEPEATASALGSMMDYFCYVWLIEGGELGQPSIGDQVAIEAMARVLYRTIFATSELNQSENAT